MKALSRISDRIDTLKLFLLLFALLALTLLETVVGNAVTLLEDMHAIPRSASLEGPAFVVTLLVFTNAVTIHLLREERRSRR